MAATSTLSNHFKYMLATKKIDLDNDVIKVMLMTPAFAFDKDAHAVLADVSASEIAQANGYSGAVTLTKSAAVAEDDANDVASIGWNDVQWTASGGAIATFGAAILYDDTTTDDTVVGCIDFGADYDVPDTGDFYLKTLAFEL